MPKGKQKKQQEDRRIPDRSCGLAPPLNFDLGIGQLPSHRRLIL
jgi:hypothetical protein